MDDVIVFRRLFDLLVEADSYEEAERRIHAQVGTPVFSHVSVYFEEIHVSEGDDQVRFFEDESHPRPRYPRKATMAALTNSFAAAERAFNELDGSFTWDPEFEGGCEINFYAADNTPPQRGTMPNPGSP